MLDRRGIIEVRHQSTARHFDVAVDTSYTTQARFGGCALVSQPVQLVEAGFCVHSEETMITKICETCKKPYREYPYRADIRKVCSNACRYGKTLEDRFWLKVKKSDGCWEWTGAKTTSGYGSFSVGAKIVYAHRFAWEMVNGPIPSGLFICHRCDNPGCVRPDHFFLGTCADNVHDAMAKGRMTDPAAEARLKNSTKFRSKRVKTHE